MDRIWSKKTCRLSKIIKDPVNHVMYHLSDGPDRAFISEELMLIPKIQSCLQITFKMVISIQQGKILLMVMVHSPHPFSLIVLLLSQCHSFLRCPYLLGTKLMIHL